MLHNFRVIRVYLHLKLAVVIQRKQLVGRFPVGRQAEIDTLEGMRTRIECLSGDHLHSVGHKGTLRLMGWDLNDIAGVEARNVHYQDAKRFEML